jgi:hypothetical protein
MRGLWLGIACELVGGCGGECQSTCEDFVVLKMSIDAPVGSLAQTSLVYCRNGACSLPTPLANNGSIESGGLCATISLGDLITTTTVTVGVDLESDVCARPVLEDGDRYSLTITDSSDQIVANDAAVATYQHHMPCGTSCEDALIELAPL